MKIEFLKVHPELEEKLQLPKEYRIVNAKNYKKIIVFLVLNPRILEAIMGKEEFDRQWNAKSE